MAFLEKHLQAAQPKAERNDAGVVGALQQLPVRGFLFQAVHQAGNHQQARRHVDVEDVFPAEAFRQPAAQGRTDGRGEGRGDGEQRHALGAMVFRQLDQGEGEGQRDQRTTGEALHGAEHDHALQAPGQGAEQRGDQETYGHPDGQAPRGEQLHQPGGEGNHDDFRHQIGGGNPRTFFQGGGERPLDVLERRVGDLDVEDRHEGAKHGAHHCDPVAPGGFARRANQCISRHGSRPSGAP
ncbi:hypothetical protein D9M72_326890 [compost metagenome]